MEKKHKKNNGCTCNNSSCCDKENEEFKIKVVDTIEHEDGSMTATFDMNQAAVKYLLGKAILDIIKDNIEWENFQTELDDINDND